MTKVTPVPVEQFRIQLAALVPIADLERCAGKVDLPRRPRPKTKPRP